MSDKPKKKYREVTRKENQNSADMSLGGNSILDALVCKKQVNNNNFFPTNSQILNQKGIEPQLEALQRIFYRKYPQAKKLIFKKIKDRPSILIEFNTLNDTSQIYLTDLVAKQKNQRRGERLDLFKRIYSSAYPSVKPQYHKFIAIAIQKLKEKIRIKIQNFLNDQIVIYYQQSKGKCINFIAFDRYLYKLNFSSYDIKNNQNKCSEEYECYIHFERSLQRNEIARIGDLKQADELNSDEEEKIKKQPMLADLKKDIQRILFKDLSEYEDQLKQMELELQVCSPSIYEQKFSDLNDLQQKLANFKQIVTPHKNKWADLSKNRDMQLLKQILRKLLIAQNQMKSKLPIFKIKKLLHQFIDDPSQQLIIVEGQTGSGKSTQIPKIIYEYFNFNQKRQSWKPILVTEPRRLATRNLAKRVSFEFGEEIGTTVDYMSTAGKRINKKAKIIYKLDRLVLDQLIQDSLLSKYSCLIIDEAHERTISMDIILGLIKNILAKRKDFRVIITSATMNTNLFKTYFNKKVLKVKGRTHQIKIEYKDYQTTDNNKKIERLFDEQLLLNKTRLHSKYKGNILVFCSGIAQIQYLCGKFKSKLSSNYFRIYALHGKLSPKEQSKIFETINEKKIIFASRIAETSITIQGVRVVIDIGEDMQQLYDKNKKISSMKIREISQSSANQRAGRAGRTQPGVCIRLYSEKQFRSMIPFKIAEIDNSPLDSIILRLKSLTINDVHNFKFISKIKNDDITESLKSLKQIGAIDKDQNITAVGKVMVKLPLEPFLSRIIVQALIFQNVLSVQLSKSEFKQLEYLNEQNKRQIKKMVIQIICMILNSSSLSYGKKQQQNQGYQNKLNDFFDSDGDFFFYLNIYNSFKKQSGKGSRYKQLQWAKQYNVSLKTFKEVKQLIQQIQFSIQESKITLDSLGQFICKAKSRILQCESYNKLLLACFVTSFCRNLALYSQNNEVGYTLISQNRAFYIHDSSILSLGQNHKWIVCYNFFQNHNGNYYCSIANKVDYNFIKKIADEYIFQKYKLNEAEHNNPFYEIIPKNRIPTQVLLKMKRDYYIKQYEKQLNFLKEGIFVFTENKNDIVLYLKQDQMQKDTKVQKFDNYIQKLKKFESKYRYNYMGNTYAVYGQGFELEELTFSNRFYYIEISNFTPAQEQYIIQEHETYGKLQFWGNKIKLLIQEKQIHSFEDYMSKFLLKYPDEVNKAKYNKLEIIEKNRTPLSKITLTYFAGKNRENKLYLYYGNQIAYQILCLIRNGISNADDKKIGLSSKNFQLSYKRDAIFCYSKLDQIELYEQLQKLDLNLSFGFGFKLPLFIIKFRQDDQKLAIKTNLEWAYEIQKLIQKCQVRKEECRIQVFGKYIIGKNTRNRLRTKLDASIETYDSNLKNKLNQFDNKKDILGSEKIHIKYIYRQLIAVTSPAIFQALRQTYDFNVQIFKSSYPHLNLSEVKKRVKNKERVFIEASSIHRNDILKVQEYFRGLFCGKDLSLEGNDYNFLVFFSEGVQVIKKLYEEYQYKIYLDIDKYHHSIKLYTQENSNMVQYITKIKEKISEQIQLKNLVEIKVNFRGKDLFQIKTLLDKEISFLEGSQLDTTLTQGTEKQKRQLKYHINYREKLILINGTKSDVEYVVNQINKLISYNGQECTLCNGIFRTPFLLFNCNHQFCWSCLVDHVNEFKNANQSILYCPKDGCKQKIHIFDIKSLVGEQEFQMICDVKLKQYIQSQKGQYLYCKNCSQIFEIKEVLKIGRIECDICQNIQCLACKAQHNNFTCEEWSRQNSIQKQSQPIKKQCESCKNEIKKEKDCNLIQCCCKAYICWHCLKVFRSKKQCERHLINDHDGVFDE